METKRLAKSLFIGLLLYIGLTAGLFIYIYYMGGGSVIWDGFKCDLVRRGEYCDPMVKVPFSVFARYNLSLLKNPLIILLSLIPLMVTTIKQFKK